MIRNVMTSLFDIIFEKIYTFHPLLLAIWVVIHMCDSSKIFYTFFDFSKNFGEIFFTVLSLGPSQPHLRKNYGIKKIVFFLVLCNFYLKNYFVSPI